MKMLLNQDNLSKWIKNQILFFSVPIIFYLTSILLTISQVGHVVTLNDFRITNIVIISFLNYVIGAAIDYLKKLRAQ